MEEAGRAKKEKGGLPGNYETEVLGPFIDDMCQQVSRSLQFFLASGAGREQPEQILICGGCANIAGAAEMIQSRVGIESQRGDPLGQMKVSQKAKAQAVKKDATALLTQRAVSRYGASTDMPRINLLPWREAERKTQAPGIRGRRGGRVDGAPRWCISRSTGRCSRRSMIRWRATII